MNLQLPAACTKMRRLLRPLALCSPLALALPASAAAVTWTAQPVAQTDLSLAADQSVVSTAGTLVEAINVAGAAITVKP